MSPHLQAKAAHWPDRLRTAPWFMLQTALDGRGAARDATWALVRHLHLQSAAWTDERLDALLDTGLLDAVTEVTLLSAELTWRSLQRLLDVLPALRCVRLKLMDLTHAELRPGSATVRDWALSLLSGASVTAFLKSPLAITMRGLTIGPIDGEQKTWLETAARCQLEEFHTKTRLDDEAFQTFIGAQHWLRALSLPPQLSPSTLDLIATQVAPGLEALDASRQSAAPDALGATLAAMPRLEALDLSLVGDVHAALRGVQSSQATLKSLALSRNPLTFADLDTLEGISSQLECGLFDAVEVSPGHEALLRSLQGSRLRMLSLQQASCTATDALETFMGQVALTHLDLSGADIGGEALGRGLQAGAENLRHLSLNSARLKGEVPLCAPLRLTHLGLNDLKATPETFKVVMDLCAADTLHTLALQHVYLDASGAQSLIALMERAAPWVLELWGCRLPTNDSVDAVLDGVADSITHLTAGQNGAANDRVVVALRGVYLPALVSLDLSNLYSQYDGIPALMNSALWPRLTQLRVASKTDADLAAIAQAPLLKQLKTLVISHFDEMTDEDTLEQRLNDSPHAHPFLITSVN